MMARKSTRPISIQTNRPEDYLLVDLANGSVWSAASGTWRLADRQALERAQAALAAFLAASDG